MAGQFHNAEFTTGGSPPAFASAVSDQPAQINIAEVFSKARKTFGARWFAFSAFAALGCWPSDLLGVWIKVSLLQTAQNDRPLGTIAALSTLALFADYFALAAITFGAARIALGRPFSLRQSAVEAFRRFPAVAGVFFLCLLGIALATLLLVIPGVVLVTICCVAPQACIVERLNSEDGILRSASLTKGNRWRVLGFLLLTMLWWALVALVVAIAADYFLGRQWGMLVVLPVDSINYAFINVAFAILYLELRTAKEGVRVDALAETAA